MTTALAFLCRGSLEEKALLIFELYDFDKSRYITKDELTILMNNSVATLRMMVGLSDFANLEEFTKLIDLFLFKADTDGD